MFAFFALQFSSGLSVYFITSNIATVVQYAIINRERLEWSPISIGALNLPLPTISPPEPVKKSSKLETGGTSTNPTIQAQEKMSSRKAKRLKARKARGGKKRGR
tara:strand:- start:301 stop:612 length:312 start_codon:yes stop_codon:yes gene_type:complete